MLCHLWAQRGCITEYTRSHTQFLENLGFKLQDFQLLNLHLNYFSKSNLYLCYTIYELCFMLKRLIISVQSCLTLRDPIACNTPGCPVHHQLLEFVQTHVHRVTDVISSSVVPFSSCLQSFPASGSLQRSQFFASDGKVLELQLQLQLQHQSFQ